MRDRVNVIDLHVLPLLRYPEDRDIIASLSLQDKIYWYSSVDARQMIFLAQTPEFQRFWKIHYLWPLRVKRFMYKIKAVFKLRVF